MKELMLGNKAVARGLYEAGCMVVSSYPGTPSTEITEETAKYVELLGGIDNIKSIDSCITRLRLTVNDSSNISDAKLKALGAKGVIRPSKDAVQIVLGQKAEKMADELRKLK